MYRINLDGDERDFLTYREGSGGTVEIFDIAVGSERGKGKGRRLIEALVEICEGVSGRLVYAFVRMSNEGAHAFYYKCGFKNFVVVAGFYEDEDAVLFIRRL